MKVDLGNKELRLDNKSMIVTETDGKGRILFASKDFCKYAEYSSDELVGQNHNFIRHPFMPKVAFKDLWDTITLGKKWSGIVVNRTKTGAYYWVKAMVYPSVNNDGSKKYISVRVMPTQNEIDTAIALYATLK
jgi:aerotaxis receptor